MKKNNPSSQVYIVKLLGIYSASNCSILLNCLAGTMLIVLIICIEPALKEPKAHREGKKPSKQTVPAHETYDNKLRCMQCTSKTVPSLDLNFLSINLNFFN